MAVHLTLLLPDIFWPLDEQHQAGTHQKLKLTALEKILRRAEQHPLEEKTHERRLFGLFNIQIDDQDDLPLAAIVRMLDKPVLPAQYYMFADPVHLRADRDSVIMLGNDMLDIKPDETDRLIKLLNSHFNPDGIHIDTIAGQHWCLSAPNVPSLHTFPINEVIGQNIRKYLPYGEDSRYWRSILNEMQMLLSASDVNREREARGELAINSLWFWGGGVLPADVKSPWSTVCGNNDLVQDLAQITGTRYEKTPEGASDWYKLAGEGEHLVVIDDAMRYRQKRDLDAWYQIMADMEKRWFSPLLDLLKSKQLSSLTIYPDTSSSYHITPALAHQWWKGIFNHKLPL